MTQYLLAAEADKIQDLLFRSARLREVVGGSELLNRFCKDVPDLLGIPQEDRIINDGGSFRLLFDSSEQALTRGVELAEVYRRATGGSLSLAEPVEVKSDFDLASEEAEEKLRRAKRWREGWQTQPHLPYVAYCASCGVGLAVAHRAFHEDEEPQYLCASCLNKGAERPVGMLGRFAKGFYEEIVGEDGLQQADWPGKAKRPGRREVDPGEDLADYDPRRYVAYFLADGNDMGQVFSRCRTKEQMHDLSDGLSHAFRQALAVPTRLIMDKNPLRKRPGFIPVLPLILGGDDLLALIPAPWALDFAMQFCKAYEEAMGELFKEIDLQEVSTPTVSVAVVICKSKHPFKLAHEAGESRLKDAKRVSKRLGLSGGSRHSSISFEVVLGGRLVGASPSGRVRPTLRPYWVHDNIAGGWGFSVRKLVEQRYELRNIPNKRLIELRDLYDDLPASLKTGDLAPWEARLNQLLVRIAREKTNRTAIDSALENLGGQSTGWYRVDRAPDDLWYGHGLPDLIEAWDFALDLGKERQEYEEGAQ